MVPNDQEPVIARLRRHGRILLLPALAFIGVVTAWGAVAPRLSELWMVVVFWIVTGSALVGLWFIPLIAWLGNRVVLTPRRVIVHQGVLVRSRQEVMLSRVHDVTVRQNAVQAVFGTGDVLLNTGAEKPVRLYDLPKANLVLSAINELVDAQAPLSAQLRRDDARWGNTGLI
jgi:uncharacterized membrane protein YdbT with pleckstrin-like domain